MNQAANNYKIMNINDFWNGPDRNEERINALKAKFYNLKKTQSQKKGANMTK